MVLKDQVIFYPFHKDEMGVFSHQVNGQPFENLKGVLYPYKRTLKFSWYMLIYDQKIQ